MLRNLDANSVWKGLVNHNWEGEIKEAGDTVIINQYGDIAVKDYVIGTAIEYEHPEGENLILKVDQQKYFAFFIDKISRVQAKPELINGYFDRAKVAINLEKDTYLSTLAFAGIDAGNIENTTGLNKDSVYGYFTALMGKLRWANVIQSNGVGFDGKRPFAVVDPDVLGVILAAPENLKSTAEGDKTSREGTVVKFAGFDIKVSTNADKEAKKVIVGTTEAITLADQITETQTVRDKDAIGGAYCSGLYVYGAKVVQPKALAGGTVTIA
ncbi:MAG: hypothetical protein IKY15_00145 [Clostridia bacterium]|nr:hypothetical protein [Clostridia bacterium]